MNHISNRIIVVSKNKVKDEGMLSSGGGDENIPLDKEEQDLLARSNKKKKTTDEGGSGGMEENHRVDEDVDPRAGSERRKSSFRDIVEMVIDSNKGNSRGEEDSLHNQTTDPLDEVSGEEDDGDENDLECPTIKVSPDEKRYLRGRRSQSLIIKLLGHTVGYTFLVRRLKALWRIKSLMDVIDVGHDVYVVRFMSKEEYERALFDGPWIIADHYLAVSRWYHDLEPKHFHVNNLAVWVRFLNLPMDYYKQSFLWKIASRIGKPLRVDMTTLSAVRGRFARVCVEVDLSKPLLAKFRLKKRIRKIVYEGMHVICFDCGRYCHSKEVCRYKEVVEGEQPVVDASTVVVSEKPLVADEVIDRYGKLMIVKKKPKN